MKLRTSLRDAIIIFNVYGILILGHRVANDRTLIHIVTAFSKRWTLKWGLSSLIITITLLSHN